MSILKGHFAIKFEQENYLKYIYVLLICVCDKHHQRSTWLEFTAKHKEIKFENRLLWNKDLIKKILGIKNVWKNEKCMTEERWNLLSPYEFGSPFLCPATMPWWRHRNWISLDKKVMKIIKMFTSVREILIRLIIKNHQELIH